MELWIAVWIINKQTCILQIHGQLGLEITVGEVGGAWGGFGVIVVLVFRAWCGWVGLVMLVTCGNGWAAIVGVVFVTLHNGCSAAVIVTCALAEQFSTDHFGT